MFAALGTNLLNDILVCHGVELEDMAFWYVTVNSKTFSRRFSGTCPFH
jgi:hypothetical protein